MVRSDAFKYRRLRNLGYLLVVIQKMDNKNLRELAALFETHREEILSCWLNETSRLPGARQLQLSDIKDHIPELLSQLAANLTTSQSKTQLAGNSAEHGVQRLKVGFDITEVVAEYHILRKCLDHVAEHNGIPLTTDIGRAVTRIFDQAVADAAKAYATLMTLEVQKKREEHLSFVIHDLRTPLHAISLAVTMLERSGSIDAKNESSATALTTLRRNITKLDILIKTVLQEEANLQFTDDPKVEQREVDLWPLVEGIVQDFYSIASDSRTTLKNLIPPDVTVFADVSLLGQVFQNLISNAIKFTAEGTVTIGAQLRHSDKTVLCWVQDTGGGIETARLDRIFEKLETDHQPEKRGVGLGLAIVKHVIELHGGSIKVESRLGEGSTFIFEIPSRPDSVV